MDLWNFMGSLWQFVIIIQLWAKNWTVIPIVKCMALFLRSASICCTVGLPRAQTSVEQRSFTFYQPCVTVTSYWTRSNASWKLLLSDNINDCRFSVWCRCGVLYWGHIQTFWLTYACVLLFVAKSERKLANWSSSSVSFEVVRVNVQSFHVANLLLSWATWTNTESHSVNSSM